MTTPRRILAFKRRSWRVRLPVALLTLAVFVSCLRNEPDELKALVDRTRPSGLKILLVGIDGATFDIINPLVKAGRLPTFKRLMEQGSRGVLKSQNPMLSPAIWTTILTGRSRTEHGILHFRNARTKKLISSSDRQTLALWNVTAPFGITNGWIGFWATWPAEPVRGYMVSDRLAHTRWEVWTGAEAGNQGKMLVWPEELSKELNRYVVDPAQAPFHEIRQLVDFTEDEMARMRAFKKPVFGHWLSVLKFAYCAQRTYEKIALYMLDHAKQPDLMGVFLIANDPICHTFWHFWHPEDFVGVDRAKAERLGRIVPNFYVHNDRYLAKLLSKADKDTIVIVVSDHGFCASGIVPKPQPLGAYKAGGESRQPRGRSGEQRVMQQLKALGYIGGDEEQALAFDQVAIGQSGQHHINGVFIACGGPIRKGARIRAEIADVTPTILALLGLPVARDMGGRVLTEIIDPDWLKTHPVRRIDSYETLIDRTKLESSLRVGEDRTGDYLKSLGYVGADDDSEETDGDAQPSPAPASTAPPGPY